MPILDVDRAKTIVVIKRSMRHGSGIDNELHTNPKTRMYFADAKQALSANHVRDQDPRRLRSTTSKRWRKTAANRLRTKHDGISDRQPVRQPHSRHLRRP